MGSENQVEKELTDEYGQTAILCAAKKGHLKVCKILLENEVDKNSVDSQQCTPLHWSAASGHSEVFKILLEISRNFKYFVSELPGCFLIFVTF